MIELGNETLSFDFLPKRELSLHVGHILLLLLIVLVIFGNMLVIFAVCIDRKLRSVTTNKFIASLAVSDLLVGIVVMPLSLYYKVHSDEWYLGSGWCQFHLVSGVFSTTASIVHLVAISLDRYLAIMFPTEYQRHSVSTSTMPYIIMIWIMALAVSSTLVMEQKQENSLVCWIENPQYIVLSSFLSFFLPGAIVVYLYIKIFKKLRNHQLYMFGHHPQRNTDKRRSLPRVIIEEVRSRRGSRMSQTGSSGGSPTRRSSGSKERSPSQPDIHSTARPQQRWRSPTICAETLAHDRSQAAKKRVSIVPDPPSMDVSCNMGSFDQMRDEHEHNKMREVELRHDDDIDPIRKKSEEEVRKLSDERRTRIAEKRRLSTQENPNGLPIMQAFQKAYAEVRCGRRRSLHDLEYGCVYPLQPLTTCDEETSLLNDNKLETESALTITESSENERKSTTSTADTVETVVARFPTVVVPPKEEPREESISTDTSQKPLLVVPNHHVKNKKPTMPCIPPPTFLMLPAMMAVNTPPLSPNTRDGTTQINLLRVPRLFDCPSPCSVPSNSSHSSYTSASGSSDTYRRISMNSYGSSLTDATDSTFEMDSRRSSAWSTLRTAVLDAKEKTPTVDITIQGSNGSPQKKVSTISRGKLRRIATQVTRAIRRKRRESLAIRRESRATRVVAAILIAFLICWIPYFCVSVFRGICTGLRLSLNPSWQLQLYIATSWLGYAHSCFNPVIYMCLNKNFRNTMKKILQRPPRNEK